MRKEVILIGNPVAGGGASGRIDKAAHIIKSRGLEVRVLLTGKRGDAETFARQISAPSAPPQPPLAKGGSRGGTLVIAAGGDGTYNEVANGLAHSDIPMAILPLGTTSVLAKELHIPGDIGKSLDIALGGKARNVHLGKITFHPPIPPLSKGGCSSLLTRYFLLMAGIGFDGETIFGISERVKKLTGKGAYIISGLKTVLRYNPPLLTIKAQDRTVAGYAAIVSKASCYGGAFRVAPDADLEDPSFYVFVTHKKGRLDLIRYVAGVVTGGHLKHPDISYFRAEGLSVEGHAHIQIDGDYGGVTPATLSIARDALKLVRPVPSS
ncbi:MAG TPA: diacylglycerol kinase family protein [Dissulfurispiraceae bacterium]